MQIRRLRVRDHKCLLDFDIRFNINPAGSSSTILIGENGTGKSTMMETVLEILMSFYSPTIASKINYDYSLEYLYAGKNIYIEQVDGNYSVTVDQELLCSGRYLKVKEILKRVPNTYFPKRIIAMYSGLNNKLEPAIRKMNSNYKKQCMDSIRDYRNVLTQGTVEEVLPMPYRRFNYCDESLVSVYLCSILCGQDSVEKRYLKENCRIDNIQSINVRLNIDEIASIFGVYEITEDSLEFIYTVIELLSGEMAGFFREGYEYQSGGKAFFELSNMEDAQLDAVGILDFFEKLQTIFGAEITAFCTFGGTRVSCKDLSEGQRQIIKILGMLGICKSEDCLVMMDEPDAHMNPKWKYELKQTIDNCLHDAVNTQAIIATHDPLVINGVPKEAIRIFTYDQAIMRNNGFYITKVIEPTEDTMGLGIDGLLQSEYYGLQTSYDKEATERFTERQDLYIKLINREATDEEKERLKELTREVGSMQMSYNSIDFLYDDFIKVFRDMPLYKKEYLTYDEIIERRRRIKEIITELYEEQA